MSKRKNNNLTNTHSGKEDLITDANIIGKWKLYGAITIFLFGFLLYVNTYANDYLMDDVFVTGQNEMVQKGIKAIPEIFTTPYAQFGKQKFDYRPIAKATYAVEYQIFGKNPHISHLIQALLYAVCCVVLFLLLIVLFPQYNILIPFATALLFTAHPIHTEVVAGLKSRDELISFLLSLIVIYLFYQAWANKRWFFYIAACLLFFLALISKISCMVLVFWVPLILYYVKPTRQIWRLAALSVIMIALNAFIILVIQGAISAKSRTILFIENPLADADNIINRVGVAINCLWFYLSKMIFPHPLGWYYGYNTMPLDALWNVGAIIALIVTTAFVIMGFMGPSYKRALFIGHFTFPVRYCSLYQH